MKISFALLPIAAALGFVEAGPVAGEFGLVCASMFFFVKSIELIITHVVDQTRSRPSHKARLRRRLLQVHCIPGNKFHAIL